MIHNDYCICSIVSKDMHGHLTLYDQRTHGQKKKQAWCRNENSVKNNKKIEESGLSCRAVFCQDTTFLGLENKRIKVVSPFRKFWKIIFWCMYAFFIRDISTIITYCSICKLAKKYNIQNTKIRRRMYLSFDSQFRSIQIHHTLNLISLVYLQVRNTNKPYCTITQDDTEYNPSSFLFISQKKKQGNIRRSENNCQ